MRLLALNSCGITSWSSIQKLEPFLPNIEELYLAENSFKDLFRKLDEASRFAAMGLSPATESGMELATGVVVAAVGATNSAIDGPAVEVLRPPIPPPGETHGW